MSADVRSKWCFTSVKLTQSRHPAPFTLGVSVTAGNKLNKHITDLQISSLIVFSFDTLKEAKKHFNVMSPLLLSCTTELSDYVLPSFRPLSK